MFNVGGGEVLVILLVALLVLGPTKLPEAARQVGTVLTQIRKVSNGFQNELRSAMDEPVKPRTPAADPAASSPAVDGGSEHVADVAATEPTAHNSPESAVSADPETPVEPPLDDGAATSDD
jgi:Tat protein translocase TatB subunit